MKPATAKECKRPPRPAVRVMERVAILGDLHCGSRFGLAPPSRWDQYTPKAVKWLWECWEQFIDEMPPVDVLILNGDITDGRQSKSDGVGVYSTSMGDQVAFAIECCESLVGKADRVIRMAGTSYHEGYQGALQAFDQHFKIRDPGIEKSIVRDIQLAPGIILNVKHQPDGGHGIYAGTTMDRETIWKTIQETCSGYPNAKFLARSHLHTCRFFGAMDKRIDLVPCWQLQAPYALMKQSARWVPSIGGTLYVRDESEVNGYRVIHRLFKINGPGQRRTADTFDNL